MSSKLVLTFGTMGGDKNFSYNYASTDATPATVKALGTAIVTNGSVFEDTPVSLKAAKLVTTTEEEYDLSD